MKEPTHRFPRAARYPLFFIGLLVMIVGNLVAVSYGAPPTVEMALGGVGLVLLALAVVFR